MIRHRERGDGQQQIHPLLVTKMIALVFILIITIETSICLAFSSSLSLPFSRFTSIQSKNAFLKGSRSQVSHLAASSRIIEAKDAIEQIYTSQKNDITQILSSIPSIIERSDLSWIDNNDQSSVIGYEAPGTNGNIAWMSSLYVPSSISSFTIYNGPLTYIPHLLSRCCIIPSTTEDLIELTFDYIPRAYGAYDQIDSNGEYPGPEQIGRVAFEYSGNRMEYETKFSSTSEIIRNIPSYMNELEDVIIMDETSRSDIEKLIHGPSFWNVRMKCTENNIRMIQNIRQRIVQDFLSWSVDQKGLYDHRPGAPVNSQYVYDTKLKQNSYYSSYQYYYKRYNNDENLARKFATAECGPLDEAYVGGGS